ncbi:MAG: hypothetical protein HY925_03425 [Elusimicrobia bacterium]|nr:hypothetical protein [Elusimicrobiota bacterium]
MKFLIFLLLLGGGVAMLLMPQYSKGLEESLAEEAAAIVKMIATTNRMYSLDFGKQWTNGPIDNSCNNGECTARQRGGPHAGCNLVACNYLAKQDWDSKKFNFYSLDPSEAPSSTNPCGSFPASKSWAACAVRKSVSDGDKEAPKFSVGWAYAVSSDGALYQSLQQAGSEPTPDPPR